MTESPLNWIAPSKKRYGGQFASPRLTVSYGPEKEVNGKRKAAYYRISANKAFMEQYYKGKTDLKISFSDGSKGLLMVIQPDGRQIPHIFRFNKSRIINDFELVKIFMKKFLSKDIENEKAPIVFSLTPKPAGEWGEYTLYRLELV